MTTLASGCWTLWQVYVPGASIARIWVSPGSSREWSRLPLVSGSQVSVWPADDLFTTVKLIVGATVSVAGLKVYPLLMVSVGFGTPQPLSPETVTCRVAPAAPVTV